MILGRYKGYLHSITLRPNIDDLDQKKTHIVGLRSDDPNNFGF